MERKTAKNIQHEEEEERIDNTKCWKKNGESCRKEEIVFIKN